MKESVSELDNLVRENKINLFRAKLKTMNYSKLRRGEVLKLAEICRRAGLPHISVRLLNPIIRPEKPFLKPATREEQAEYALDLNLVGAREEAVEILETVVHPDFPLASLYLGLALISGWDYEAAIEHFEFYSQSNKVSKYQRQVGALNLAACYIVEKQFHFANEILADLEAELDSGSLLAGNVLELKGQILVLNGKFNAARKVLKSAMKLFVEAESPYKLFVQIWTALADFYESPNKKSVMQKLNKLRNEAKDRQLYESVRMIDFHIATKLKRKQLFLFNYYGSPYESYRQRLTEEFEDRVDLPDHFYWGHQSSIVSLDIESGIESRSQKELFPEGQLLNNFLRVICSDFYKPQSVGVLFSRLFPGEYFNPIASPDRIYQIVKRTREILENEKVPIEISEHSGNYHLKFLKPYKVNVPYDVKPIDIQTKWLSDIRGEFSDQAFSIKQICQHFQISRGSALIYLNFGLEQGQLVKTGKGRGVKYQFK